MSTNKNAAHTKTAVSYVRVACAGDNAARLMLSQWEITRKKARELNIKDTTTFFDIGTPADYKKRRGFQRMMEYIRQNKVDYVIFSNTSRLSRKTDIARELISDIEKTGATPVFVNACNMAALGMFSRAVKQK